MKLTDLIENTKDFASAHRYLQEKSILWNTPPACPACDRLMTEVKNTGQKTTKLFIDAQLIRASKDQ
jgi:hypothetical protein